MGKMYLLPFFLWLFCFPDFGATDVSVNTTVAAIFNVRKTSFEIVINPLDDVVTYYISVAQRHDPWSTLSVRTKVFNVTVDGLSSDTLYDVSIKCRSTSGILVQFSNVSQVHTLPDVTIRTSPPLPDSMFVFLPDNPRVTQWTVQYREQGEQVVVNVTTQPGSYYAVVLKQLHPNTKYDLRARASEFMNQTIDEVVSPFGDWVTAKTDALSVFGRVILENLTYASRSHNGTDVMDSKALAILEDAYRNHSNVLSVQIIEIETIASFGGAKARVHYELKVADKVLPANGSFLLNSSSFQDGAINNGDNPIGGFYIDWEGNLRYFGFYYDGSRDIGCNLQGDRLVLITDENSLHAQGQLYSREKPGPTSLVSMHILDDKIVDGQGNIIITDLRPNTVNGLAYKYVVQDCSRNQSSESLYFISHKAVEYRTGGILEPFLFTTGILPRVIDVDNITYSSSYTWREVTIFVPAVAKAILYEVLHGSTPEVISTLEEGEIDGSDFMTIILTELSPGTNYSLHLRVTTLGNDGQRSTASSSSFHVIAGKNTVITTTTSSEVSTTQPTTTMDTTESSTTGESTTIDTTTLSEVPTRQPTTTKGTIEKGTTSTVAINTTASSQFPTSQPTTTKGTFETGTTRTIVQPTDIIEGLPSDFPAYPTMAESGGTDATTLGQSGEPTDTGDCISEAEYVREFRKWQERSRKWDEAVERFLRDENCRGGEK